MTPLAVVALGGNALLRRGEPAEASHQQVNVRAVRCEPSQHRGAVEVGAGVAVAENGGDGAVDPPGVLHDRPRDASAQTNMSAEIWLTSTITSAGSPARSAAAWIASGDGDSYRQ